MIIHVLISHEQSNVVFQILEKLVKTKIKYVLQCFKLYIAIILNNLKIIVKIFNCIHVLGYTNILPVFQGLYGIN